MNQQIQDILNDLYRIDPQFKAHEKELVSLVTTLISAKPDTKFDEAFASRLRAELMETKIRPMPSPYSSFFISRAFYGIVGSAITILVVVPFTFIATQKATSPEKPIVLNPFTSQIKDETAVLTPKQQISNKGINAFGTFALVPTNQGSAVQTDSVSKITPTALIAPSATEIAPIAVQAISYSYTGEVVELKDKEGKIFMRTKGIDSDKQLRSMIQGSNFGLAKLGTFSDLKLTSIELSENKENGYTVGINFVEGSININPQWNTWPADTNRKEVSSLPSEATIIGIADAFVRDHGIDTMVYGKPVVQQSTSQVVGVSYPLIIEGKPVYDESGAPYGLYVAVDIRLKKVSGVNNLISQTYDSSFYTLETNFDAIVQAATSSLNAHVGGMDPQVRGQASGTATLGTPTQVLMHYWYHDEAKGITSELYIPALSFPITYESKNAEGLPTKIVIPLVKDFLAKQTSSKSVSTSE